MREILSCYSVNWVSQMWFTLIISLLLRKTLPSDAAPAIRDCAGGVWCWLLPSGSSIPSSGSDQTMQQISSSVHGGSGWERPSFMCRSPFCRSVMWQVVLGHHVSSLLQKTELCTSFWSHKDSWSLYETGLDSGTSHHSTGRHGLYSFSDWDYHGSHIACKLLEHRQ